MSLMYSGNIAGAPSSIGSFGQYVVPTATVSYQGPSSVNTISFTTSTTSSYVSLSSNIFTVSSTGIYLITWNIDYSNANFTGNPSFQTQLYVNNGLYSKESSRQGGGNVNYTTGGFLTSSGSVCAFLNANDQFYIATAFSINSNSSFNVGTGNGSQCDVCYLGPEGVFKQATSLAPVFTYTTTTSPQLVPLALGPLTIYAPYAALNNDIFSVFQTGRYGFRMQCGISNALASTTIMTMEMRAYVNGVYTVRGPLFQTSNSCCYTAGGLFKCLWLFDLALNENDQVQFFINVIAPAGSFDVLGDSTIGNTVLFYGPY